MSVNAPQSPREPPVASPPAASDVVVVGGGLVGLALGVALAKAGVTTLVIDRESPATALAAGFDGRASAIAFASARVLQGLGVWPDLAPVAEPIREIRVSDGDSLLFLHYDHREVGPEPLGYIIENRHLRRALHAAAAKLDRLVLIAPGELAALERGPARIEATLVGGACVRARLAIAADGRASPTREAAGIRTIGWRYRQTGIVTSIRHQHPHRGIAQERFLPAGPFAVLPLVDGPAGEHRSSLVWTEREELAPAMMALEEHAFAAEIALRLGDGLGWIEAAGPRWAYPLGLLQAERYVERRLALVGDSAHAIHPIAGQGLNLGLRDVASLAECVVDAMRLGLDIGASDVLERYQRWRRFDNLVLMAVTDGLNRLFSNDIEPIRAVRDLGLSLVEHIGPLKRLFMRHAMGTLGDLPRLARGEAL